jgi:hypothetical protein
MSLVLLLLFETFEDLHWGSQFFRNTKLLIAEAFELLVLNFSIENYCCFAVVQKYAH